MTVEGPCAEVESDSDSGKGTILSDNLESPVRDSPLSFPHVHDWNSSRFSPQRNPNGRTSIITDHEQLCGEECGKEKTRADACDCCPVSPTSEIGYESYALESPSAVSRLSRISHRGVSGSVESSHHVQSAEAELGRRDRHVDSAEELLTSRFSFVDPGFPGASVRNDSNLPVRLSPGRYDATAMTQHLAIVTNVSDQRHLSYNKDDDYLCDSKEVMATYNNINNDNNDYDDDMRQQLKTKCQYLFGSGGIDFGTRETNNSRFGSGQDVGRGYSEYEQSRYDGDAPTMHRDRRSCKSIFAGSTTSALFRFNDDDLTTESSRPRGHHDTIVGSYGNRRQSNNVRYLSLNDPLSTTLSTAAVRKDWSPAASNPSDDRGTTGRQMAGGFEQWESASSRCHDARRRWQETSFNSTVEFDPVEEEEAAVFPSGLPPLAGEYLRSRSVPYDCEPVGPLWKCERRILPTFTGIEASSSSATLPRQSRTPWGGARERDPGVVQTTPFGDPDKDRHRRRHHAHTARRWTNPGPSEEDVDPTPSNPNPKSSSRRTEFDLSVSKRQQRSTTSIAPQDRLGRERGTGPAKSDDLEMVDLFDPSKSASAPNTPSVRTDGGSLSRGFSFPDPDGRPKPSSPGISFLQRIRSRLPGRMRRRRDDSPVTNSGAIVSTDQQHFGATARHHDVAYDRKQHQQQQGTSAQDDLPTRIGRDGVPDDAGSVVKATGILLRFNSLQESADDEESSAENALNFSTLQHQKSKAENQTKSWTGGQNAAKRMSPSSISHVNTAAAAAAAGKSVVGFESVGQVAAAPSSEVAVTLFELDELVSLVDAHAARVPETGDRTISEDEFGEYRRAMIDALRDFIENCKLMVIRTPASSAAGFADDIGRCGRLLGAVVDRYGPLVDCSSLPADRARFADGVGAVATSFRETVAAASAAAGLTAKHPAVRALRARSCRLVVDLTDLMRMVRAMNYNRISRRF